MTISLVTLMLIVIVSTLYDLRERRIPNALLVVGALIGLLFSFVQPFMPSVIYALLGGLIGLLLFLIPYAFGKLGAADVKLMAVVGVFLGPVLVLKAILYTMLAGGAVALFYGWYQSRHPDHAVTLPYALAIASGVMLTLLAEQVS